MTRPLVITAVIAFLVLGFAVPLAAALGQGVLDPVWLREVWANPALRAGVGNAVAIATVTTALAVAIALPLAWLTTTRRLPGGAFAEGLLLCPLLLPPFVGAVGIQAVLGRHGALNAGLVQLGLIDAADPPDWLGAHRFAAVCLLDALSLYPLLYLALCGAISRLDPALLEAARACGATPFTALRTVAVPLIAPALLAAAALVWTWSFTELGAPLMLGFDRHIAVQIFAGLSELSANRLPFALAVVALAIALTVHLGAQRLFARRAQALLGKGSAILAPKPLTRRGALLAWAAVLAVAALAAFPHLSVVLLAFSRDWYAGVWPTGATLEHAQSALANPLIASGMLVSLQASLLATVVAVIVGIAIAWTIERWRPRGWQLIDAAAMAPIAVPGIVLALGFLAVGSVIPGYNLAANPSPLLVLAYAVRRLPQVVRSTHSALQQVPPALEEAAAVHGAGPWTRLSRVTLPLILGGLCAGAVLTFSFSMLEVADSLMLTQRREHWPLTKVMYGLTDILGTGPAIACAVGAWAMALIAAAVAAAAALSGRGIGGLFRER